MSYSGDGVRFIGGCDVTLDHARGGDSEADVKSRTLALHGIRPHLALHALHCLAQQGQSDARALIARRMQTIEDLEDLVAIGRIEAYAIVANLDDVAAGLG